MLRTLREVVPECHVLVVDDGSPDGTGARARAVGAELGQITVLERSRQGRAGRRLSRRLRLGPRARLRPLRRDRLRLLPRPARAARPAHRRRATTKSSLARATSRAATSRTGRCSRRLLSRGGNQYASMIVLDLKRRRLDRPASASTPSRRWRRLTIEPCTADGYGFQIEMTYRARQHRRVHHRGSHLLQGP